LGADAGREGVGQLEVGVDPGRVGAPRLPQTLLGRVRDGAVDAVLAALVQRLPHAEDEALLLGRGHLDRDGAPELAPGFVRVLDWFERRPGRRGDRARRAHLPARGRVLVVRLRAEEDLRFLRDHVGDLAATEGYLAL